MRRPILLSLLLAALAYPATALDLRGPKLAAASSFGQGVPPGLLDRALELGIRDLRDELFWYRVQDAEGRFHFDEPMTTYPDVLAAGGATVSLLVNNGHPAFAGGTTPLSEEAVAGFGRHAAEVVRRFPAVTSVEVGNEFNSDGFVSGPLRGQDLDARARAYVALLKSVHDQVGAVRPGIRIIGGGVHSIPTGYLRRILDLGAARYMDSIALHPYDTPVEQLRREIAVMRRLPQLARMPVEITEFGSQDAAEAPGKLLRGYCQMALSGVSRMAWYALNQRGDGFVPLIDEHLGETAVTRAFLFARATFEGLPVADAAPDPFTYGCLFDRTKLVIWGMPRTLDILSPGLEARDATGRVLEGRRFNLSETEPLVLLSPRPLEEGRDYVLGPQPVVADSFHQFAFPGHAGATPPGTPFRRFVREGRRETPLVTMPGQDGPGRPWTPWLGDPHNGDVRVLARVMLPAGTPGRPLDIVTAFVAPADMRVDVSADWALVGQSADGVTLTVRLDGRVLASWSGGDGYAYDARGMVLKAGSVLEFALGPGATTKGDLTRYRITIRHAR